MADQLREMYEQATSPDGHFHEASVCAQCQDEENGVVGVLVAKLHAILDGADAKGAGVFGDAELERLACRLRNMVCAHKQWLVVAYLADVPVAWACEGCGQVAQVEA